jgi:glycosyltransferase involved in cell wall biosynthesis
MVGTDLVARFSRTVPLDHFGMTDGDIDGVNSIGDVPQNAMHAELARRRVYLHPMRWTSLGLSLIEAMQAGMPVVVLDSTEAARAVPPGGGVVSADPDELLAALRRYLAEPEEARIAGKAARAGALDRYGLDRFLADWDRLLEEVSR